MLHQRDHLNAMQHLMCLMCTFLLGRWGVEATGMALVLPGSLEVAK